MRAQWQRWAERRFLWQGHKLLKQKDVLVFVYRPGYIYVALILITFVAGVNYANNLILAFCFLISSLLCISFYLAYRQLKGLEITLDYDDVGQVGQAVELIVTLSQTQPRERYLSVNVGLEKQYLHLQHSSQQLRFHFYPAQRGAFYYPDLSLMSMYPLGLVRAWTHLYLKQQLITWVAPQAVIQPHQQQSMLEAGMDEFYELKNYQLGDSLTYVAWKQLARGQGMYIKQFAPHAEQQQLLIDYAALGMHDHEQKLKVMMGLIEQCEQQQQPYAIKLPQQQLSLGLGEAQLQQAKRLLAEA
ncbi:DUF58 domain-containing protein [Acinetobacter sp. B51(2017)]|uniref:DUF58 domain-containing protein n=1 Tax=Acinetobacter sp. B51(2017) TaxID=2060938 RepID=UPI000F080796|nr:DUF58 domain-containing protein [Acinetobacter sp. B51(2017)]